jgi:D-alanine transaminase
MARHAYVNGRFVHHSDAAVHIEDRGFQFADGVYEVITVMGGAFIDELPHLKRLHYSLGELKMAPPMSERAMRLVMRELVRRNGLKNGVIYLQISRGVAPRDFRFPENPKSTIVMTTRRMALSTEPQLDEGVKVITIPDIRWARRDIKSTGLLAQVLAKQQASEAGAYEAWMIDGEGFVTEGASSNAWILTEDGVLVTRQADGSVLHGVTGNSIERLAVQLEIKVERRPFSVAEAVAAREAFISSATTFCQPVTQIDGQSIANGHPGEVTRRLRQLYLDYGRHRQDRPFTWPE